jgi:tripartite-type tricarboxylate transporter receptor subunit TctC
MTTVLGLSRRALLGAALVPGSVLGQSRAVRLIVGAAAGTGIDLAARAFAQPIGQGIQATVMTINRPSAGGVMAAEAVARAAPDGETLLYSSLGPLAIAPATMPSVGYHPVRDFTHLACLGITGFAVAVPAGSPVRSVPDLLALLRRKGAAANYGTTIGSIAYRVAAGMIAQASGGQASHVGYQRPGDLIADLLRGALDFTVDLRVLMEPFASAGQLRLLAVTSAERDPAAPDLPCMHHFVPGLELEAWAGISGPAGMAPQLVEQFEAAARAALDDPEVVAMFRRSGGRPRFLPARDYTALVTAELPRVQALVRASGVPLG